MEPFDLILSGGTCVTPGGTVRADVGVRGGRVAALGDLESHPTAEKLDATGLHVLPGVMDTQVHFREPGFPEKEDIGSGSASAALGGVTAFLEMPNTRPSTDSAEHLRFKLERAAATSWVDHGFFIGATAENAEKLAELEALPGCPGVKMFLGSSTGTLLVDREADQRRVLQSGKSRVACHSEDEARLQQRKGLFDGQGVERHPDWRDVETARLSTERLLRLARETGRRVHVLHVTTAEELPLLAQAKDVATCEVTPQHLTLAAPECYRELGTLAQMNPPIREARHREALWRAVQQGLFDVIGSDHAPHTLEEKARPWPQSPSGMPGVQTLLPVMLNHVHHGRLSLERLVDLTSHGPARVWGMRGKGRLAVGHDADFSVVDLKARRTITREWSKSRCGWTPFEGMEVVGWPVATVVRGRVVMRDGALQGPPAGQPIRFHTGA